jgi:uncharacterized protein (TIGR02598 family)
MSTKVLKQQRIHGFSLTEVSLAVAIVGFCFTAILGLMCGGLSQYRDAMDSTVTAQIAQRVIHDAQQTEFSVLVDADSLGSEADESFTFRAPRIAAPAFRYFDAQGTELHDENEIPSEALRQQAVYQVNVRIRPYAFLPHESQSLKPTLAQVTVQVAHLPATQAIEIEPARGERENLFKNKPGVPVYTYSALVARNE